MKSMDHLRALVALDPGLPPMDESTYPPTETLERKKAIDDQVDYLRRKVHTYIVDEMCQIIEAERERKARLEEEAKAAQTPTSSSSAGAGGSNGEPPTKRMRTAFSGISAMKRASKGLTPHSNE